jgi:hypothetical protein
MTQERKKRRFADTPFAGGESAGNIAVQGLFRIFKREQLLTTARNKPGPAIFLAEMD